MADSDGGSSNNGSAFVSRREIRASNATGALPSLGNFNLEYNQPDAFDFELMLKSLHDLFEHDRQIASSPDSTRCGICYLHYSVAELQYRDEGFYVCQNCSHNLGSHKLSMLRKQQKL